MEKNFWLERWERKEIGFHQDEVNAYLHQHWHEVMSDAIGEVFVPLCGKSLDMVWLRQQGHTVLGIELSALAVEEFFQANTSIPTHTKTDKFSVCAAAGIHIICGDFFDLDKHDMVQVRAVYDRAALVALPPEMRERYARHLVNILPPASKILLVTFDYAQAEMSGPPFAVSASEVEKLYGAHAHIQLLAQHDVLAQNPRFQERGVSKLRENIFLLTLQK